MRPSKHSCLQSAKPIALATVAAWLTMTATSALAGAIGPSEYLEQSDSPLSGPYTYFYLEDFEDDALNTPGVTASGHCISGFDCFVGGSLTDSVDGDDGVIDGGALSARSLWASGSVSFTFDATELGAFPTDVGIVWTDGVNPITFEAFDENGASLGTIVGDHADGAFTGATAEDRFYGWTNADGISRIVISDPSGIEVDHLQYGFLGEVTPVAEPETLALIALGLVAIALVRRRTA